MPAATRRRRALVAAAVFVATLVPFLPALRNGFVDWDDVPFLVQNTAYRGFGPDELRWMFTDVWHGPYQPLAWLSYAVDHAVWGLDPTGFHLSSMLLHAVAAVALFAAAARLLPIAVPRLVERPGGCLAGAAFVAVLWSIHPLRVESVAWASERRDVLSALFLFLSLGVWLRYVTRPASSWWRRGAYWGSLALYAAALLSKATPVGWPLVLLLLDCWPLRRVGVRGSFVEKLPFVVLAAAAAVVAWIGQEVAGGLHAAGGLHGVGGQALIERLGVAGYSASFYVVKSLAPVGLRALYVGHAATAGMAGQLAAGALAALAVSLWAVVRRRPAGACVAWLAYLALLAPVSGLVPVGSQLVADRFAYLAAAPLGFLVVGVWASAARHRLLRSPRAELLAVACLLLLGATTWRQTTTWRSTEALFEHVLAVDPHNWEARGRLAALDARAGRTERAVARLEESLRMEPEQEAAVAALADLYLVQRRPRDAFALLDRFLEKHPDSARAQGMLGGAFRWSGDPASARRAFERALAGDPGHVSSLLNLAEIEEAEGRYDESERLLRRAADRERGALGARLRLARFLADRGHTADAEAELRAGLALVPDAGEAHLELGLLLRRIGREPEALEAFRRAEEIGRATQDPALAGRAGGLLPR